MFVYHKQYHAYLCFVGQFISKNGSTQVLHLCGALRCCYPAFLVPLAPEMTSWTMMKCGDCWLLKGETWINNGRWWYLNGLGWGPQMSTMCITKLHGFTADIHVDQNVMANFWMEKLRHGIAGIAGRINSWPRGARLGWPIWAFCCRLGILGAMVLMGPMMGRAFWPLGISWWWDDHNPVIPCFDIFWPWHTHIRIYERKYVYFT